MLYYDTAKILQERGSRPWSEANSVDGGCWFPFNLEQSPKDTYTYKDWGPKYEYEVDASDTVKIRPLQAQTNRSTQRYTSAGWSERFRAMFAGRQAFGVSRTAYKGLGVGEFEKSNPDREAVFVFTPLTFMTPTSIENLAILPVRARWVGSPDIARYAKEKVNQIISMYKLMNFSQMLNDIEPSKRYEIRDAFHWKTFADWDGINNGGDIAFMCGVHAMSYSHAGFRYRNNTGINHSVIVKNIRRWAMSPIVMGELYRQIGDYQLYRAEYPYPYAPVPERIVAQ